MKTGLVVEGGGVRAMYAAGVLDELTEQGVKADGVIGVSAGAVHGSSFVSGQIGRSLRYYLKYIDDPRFMGIGTLLKTGSYVGEQFCYHDLPEKLDPFDYKAFNESEIPFYAVCTNVETGRAEYIRITDMLKQIDVLLASASLPYLSRIVETEGMKLLDGGCSDSIPVRAFQKMGYERNIVVLTRHEGYVKKPQGHLMPSLFYGRKYPAFCRTLEERHVMYNAELDDIKQMDKEGSAFVIRPKIRLDIGRISRDKIGIQKVYDQGRAEASRRMPALKEWLGK